MDTTTLTAQDTDGACSGTIQISNDNFATCLGGILDASDPYFIMFEGLTEFSSQAGSEVYKIKVTTGVKDVTGASPLTANYQMATGFTVAGSYVDLGNGTIADNESYLVWSQCPEGTSGSGCGTGGVDTSLVFCNENDDDCNGGFEGGTLLDGLISDGTQVNAAGTSSVYSACEALNSSVFGGRTSWRVPSEYELFVFEYNYYANSSFATYFPFDYTSIDGLWAMESIDFENALFLDLTGNGNYIAYKDGTGYLDEADFNYYSFSTGLGVHCVSDEYPF
ncbi:MAG: hypothetical protein KDK36_14255 [Leptospiraceae bacterium]|nr:hypothetical protein [Leptospiraceae bacterium]